MVDEALGGMLSGRFQSWHLGPLSQEFALDLSFRLAKRNGLLMTEALALAIWELTKGYPYSIGGHRPFATRIS